MPLILAIEPDRRQAAQLTALIRHHVGAELILADTTEGALVAIGHRVPDLVLVPALLAPQDDAALASALRVIAAAAHVRTLTIPVFASGVRKAAPRKGMLARLGLGRGDDTAPAGCDPTVFAEQVIAYLNEAAADREATHAHADDATAAAPLSAVALPRAETAPASIPQPAPAAIPPADTQPVYEPISLYVPLPPLERAPRYEPYVPAAPEEPVVADEAGWTAELPADERVPVYEPPAAYAPPASEPQPYEAAPVESAAAEDVVPFADVEPPVDETPDDEPAVAD